METIVVSWGVHTLCSSSSMQKQQTENIPYFVLCCTVLCCHSPCVGEAYKATLGCRCVITRVYYFLQENLDAVGDVLLQDTFNVWDPKALIKKGRERHLFLFEMCLVFAKEVKDSNGKTKYMYKFKLMVSGKGEIVFHW